MKYFILPTAVLALLLGLSLWNAREIEGLVSPWCDALEKSVSAAEQEDWDSAANGILTVRNNWSSCHPYFHIVTAHDELDQADDLFAQAESYAVDHELPELRASVSALIVQLRVVAEMQKLTIRNVL